MDLSKTSKKKEEKDEVYKEVVLQIREVLKEDLLDFGKGFDKEKQDEVIKILQDNFDIGDQIIGKFFLENTLMFNRDTGEILTYYIPFFMCPMWMVYGYKAIIPNNCFPTYNIKNKYMGFCEGNKFYKAPSRIELLIRRDTLGFMLMVGILIYIVLYSIYYGFNG